MKLIFFDMDGPIFEPEHIVTEGKAAASAWTLLAQHIGPECHAEVEATKGKWTRGEYRNYLEWCEDSLNIYKKYGLDKDFFDKVIQSVKYIPGVKETVEELRRRKYAIAIISGGLKNLANRAIVELGIHHAYAAAELFFDPDTKKLIGWNILPSDYERKVDFMHAMIKEHGLEPEDCFFVGDGINDVHLAKEVGTSIAFNGRRELQAVATHSVNQKEKDLRAILEFLP